MSARRLRGARPATTVPEWAEPALRPASRPWPEDEEQWELTIVDEHGRHGRYGTFSSVVLQIIRLQIAPALARPFTFSPGAADEVPALGRHRSGSHYRIAVSVVDLALWDLLTGQAAATTTTFAAYASALGFDLHHPIASDLSAWLSAEGYGAQKWRLSGEMSRIPDDLRRVAEIGAAAGGVHRVLVDGVAGWPADYASRIVPELAALGIGWIEEPVAGGVEQLTPLAGPGVRLAWGEHAYDRTAQHAALTSGLVDVWQPDVGWCGGLSAAVAATRMARDRGIPVCPHGGSLIAGCALAAWCGSEAVPAVEYHLTQEPVRQRFSHRPLFPVAGRIRLADVVAARDLRVDDDHSIVDLRTTT
jgi:L-rhamnonate dehydratase